MRTAIQTVIETSFSVRQLRQFEILRIFQAVQGLSFLEIIRDQFRELALIVGVYRQVEALIIRFMS